ncbi:MAG: polymorphic toxin-type HINT domain-containing protein [Gemmataceae bacterium]
MNEILIRPSVPKKQARGGRYNGGSFSYASTVYSASSSDSVTSQDISSSTLSGTWQSSDSWSNYDDDAGIVLSDSGSESDNIAETINNSDSTTTQVSDVSSVYQAGGFSGGSYQLGSFSLSQSSTDTTSIDNVDNYSSVDTGSGSGDTVIDGYTEYLGNSTYSDSSSGGRSVVATYVNGSSLSQGGSFSNGSYGLSNYAFSANQSSNVNSSESATNTDNSSGSNQCQSYSGGSSGSVSANDVSSSSGSLSQQGSYGNGSFTLSAVSYSGSGSDSFSNTSSDSSHWSGGYSGTSSTSDNASGNSSYTESATGCYSNGSYSLSSVSLSGGSTGSYTIGSSRSQTLNGVSSSESSTDVLQESESLYQTGTSQAGQFSTASYNYSDSSSETTTASAQAPSSSSSETQVATVSTQERGSGTSGTETLTASTSNNYVNNGTAGTGSSSSSTTTQPNLPNAPVSLAAPDATSVAGANGEASGTGTASGAGSSSNGAPVGASPSLNVVQTTDQWLSGQGWTAQQATDQGASKAATSSSGQMGAGNQGVAGSLIASAATTSNGYSANASVETAATPSSSGSVLGQLWSGFKSYLSDNGVSDLLEGRWDDAIVKYLSYQTGGLSTQLLTSQWFGSTLDTTDRFFAGWSDNLTGGLSTKARTAMYGELATRNHTGTAFQVGQVFGFVNNVGLIFVNPCSLGSVASTGFRALNMVQGVGSLSNAWGDFQQGNYGSMALNLLGAAGNLGSLLRACFAAGTPLLTPTGSKPIEQFRVGDLLLSRSEDDPEGRLEAKAVEEVFVRTARIMRLGVRGQLIKTTAEHPFWVKGKGWLSAAELQVGELLSSHDGQWVAVEAVSDNGDYEPVYNVRVADYHTYFVGTVLSVKNLDHLDA